MSAAGPVPPVVSVRFGVWSMCLAVGSIPVDLMVLVLSTILITAVWGWPPNSMPTDAEQVFGTLPVLVFAGTLVPAMVLGVVSIGHGRRGRGQQRAVTALVLGSIGIALAVIIGGFVVNLYLEMARN